MARQPALLLLLARCHRHRLDEPIENQFPLPRKVSHFSSASRLTFHPPFTASGHRDRPREPVDRAAPARAGASDWF
jgi:hypothetical protein